MDAAEFFRDVVKPNYAAFEASPGELRLLWNTIVSMNSMAEFLALDRLGYEQIARGALDKKAAELRKQLKGLEDLKFCAETFKHVRKIKDHREAKFSTIATSTGVSSADQGTWKINEHDVATVVRQAYRSLEIEVATRPEKK